MRSLFNLPSFRLTSATAMVVTVIACGDSTGPEPPPVVRALAVDATSGPIDRTVSADLDASAVIQVTYWRKGDPDALQRTIDDVATSHDVYLPRLRPNSTYQIEVRAVSTNRQLGAPRRTTLTTGALPAAVAALAFQAQGSPTDPLVMIEVMSTSVDFSGVVLLDGSGEVVWYWQSQGMLMGASRRENGNWVFQDAGRLVEVSPDRSIVRELPAASAATPYEEIHHDLIVTPANTVYFIARETRDVGGSPIVGEAIWEWEPEASRVTKRWSAFDFLAWPADRGPDSAPNNWMHMNALSIGSRGNVIFSARSLDQVVSIAPNFQSLEWRLGGVNATIPATGDAHFSGQHNVSEIAPGRILMFDNGRRRESGLYSRAVELAVNTQAGTVSQVWEFRATPDRLHGVVGGAFRKANGNTLVTYGFGGGPEINVYEVSPTGTVLWHLVAPIEVVRIYKSRPLASLTGERTVPVP